MNVVSQFRRSRDSCHPSASVGLEGQVIRIDTKPFCQLLAFKFAHGGVRKK